MPDSVQHIYTRHMGPRARAVLFVSALLLVTFTLLALTANAQDEAPTATPTPPSWSQPFNLSQSGAASDPQLLALDGQYLVFWRDAVDGLAWTRGDGQNWEAPATGEFPFATRIYFEDLQPESPTPIFIPRLAAQGDTVHAVWSDDQDILYHSAAPAAQFGTFSEWQPRQALAPAALAPTLHTDPAGRLHLAYIRPTAGDAPAGLYHRRSQDGGETWSDPTLLYPSNYFRLLTAEEANIQMASSGDHVYIAADERAREQILLVHSGNGGQSWGEPQIVDRRQETDSNSAAGPAHARLAVQAEQLHVTWQAGHEGFTCAQYHQYSTDNGQSWEPQQRLLPSLAACPDEAQLLAGDEALVLLANTGAGHYLLSWQADRWSEPLLQSQLRGFADPNTFRQIEYTCGQTAALHDGDLTIAACGEGAAQDIWFLSRPLAPVLANLSTTPVWSTPAPVVEPPAPDGTAPAQAAAVPRAPILIPGDGGADGEGGAEGAERAYHAMWAQAAPVAPVEPTQSGSGGPTDHIYYARWDGARWSRPVPIIGEAGHIAQHPAAVLTPQGRLLLAWSGGANGEALYSLAAAARAGEQSEWTEPRPLPAPRPAAGAPHLLPAPDGAIHAVYPIPLNEQRGIYLTTSFDGGETWTEPTTVFDAAAAGWEMVDAPRLALTTNAGDPGAVTLHAIWLQRALPDTAPTAALHYARSDDGGETWSEPQMVENGTPQQGPVVAARILAAGERTVHRVWQESDGARLNLWHQYSQDHGLSWSRAARVGGLGQSSGPFALLRDPALVPHLVELSGVQPAAQAAPSGAPSLQHYTWDAAQQRWQQNAAMPLANVQPSQSRPQAVAAAVHPDGQLAVLVAQSTDSPNAAQPPLSYVSRPITVSGEIPTPLPTLTPTPQPTPEPTATPAAQATATAVFPTTPGQGARLQILPSIGANSLALGALLALIPAVALVTVILFILNRRQRK